ncbi:putative F-box/LRR-repeat protein 9 [Silene latifolia]|uniref:putative F-box/LRR-repeat protein 9 n=1 Tax=Silene latifolia TaxID=37657 RepID=UPI003D77BD0A
MPSNSNPNVDTASMNNSELSPENYRNMSDLPLDVTLMILKKIGAVEILESVQFVCKMLYNLCKEPSIWRTIHILNLDEPNRDIKHEKMLFNAIDRSDGGLIDLDIEGFGSDQLCSYFASRSSQLRRLRLAYCQDISANAVAEALEKLTSLEGLELTGCSFQLHTIATVINSCPSLVTTFIFNKVGSLNPCHYPDFLSSYQPCDEEAFAIAGSMPELRHLQLMKNNITNVGLTAILDACPHLQSLHLYSCFYLYHREENLRKRLSEQVNDLQELPYENYDEVHSDYSEDYASDDETALYYTSKIIRALHGQD